MNTRIAIVLVIAACSSHRENKPVVKSSTATQQDLARELDDAERRGTQAQVRQHWLGLSLHWTVTRQRLLCQDEHACHVAPFAVERPAKHGWLPALTFAPGEFRKIEAACGQAMQCQLEFEGKLDELVASPEMPTSLRFSDVHLVTARAG
jgi:hypothetical protein